MYEQIARRIEARLMKGPRVRVARGASEPTRIDKDKSVHSAYVTLQMAARMNEMYTEQDAAEAAAHSRETGRDFGGLRSQRQLENHFVERVTAELGGAMQAFDFTVPSGTTVLGPPYDVEWQVGNAIAFGAKSDGQVITLPTPNGFSAAGIGFYLTTNEPVLAAITPQGTYKWNWFALDDLPFARSSGGMGIAIYTDSQPQPTMSREAVLWSLSGMTKFTGQQGSDLIANAASPAFGLGTVPLAPALINMLPGSRYLVWVWCWQTSQLENESAFIAFLSSSMPFVTIAAGPTIVIH